jgi:hypothetical protein
MFHFDVRLASLPKAGRLSHIHAKDSDGQV